jgi:hypothetical protein
VTEELEGDGSERTLDQQLDDVDARIALAQQELDDLTIQRADPEGLPDTSDDAVALRELEDQAAIIRELDDRRRALLTQLSRAQQREPDDPAG